MHSDPAAVKKSVRSYMIVFVSLMVFTVITVAVSGLHFAVPIAITVALVIAAMKGSMVAGVFMHLSHEKQWIYGALLLTVALLHRADVRAAVHGDGPHRDGGPGSRRPRPWSRAEMSLRSFHLFFIAISVMLAAFLAAWAAGAVSRGARRGLRRGRRRLDGCGGRPRRLRQRVQAQDETVVAKICEQNC